MDTPTLMPLLHRASQMADERFMAEQAGTEANITPRQLAILERLALEEGTSQTKLTDITGIDRSTVADIMRRLEDRGLVSRRRRKEDSRTYSVKLTAEGRNVLRFARRIAERADDRLTSLLGSRDSQELVRLLTAMTSADAKPATQKDEVRDKVA